MTQPTINMQQQQQQQQQQLDDPESELLLMKLEREHRQQQQQQQQQQHHQQQQQLELEQQHQQQLEQTQEQGLEHERPQEEDTQPNLPPARVGASTGRNVALTNANRRDICLQRAAHPAMTLEALAIWAQLEFNLARKPAMGTLSRILSKQSRYSSMNEIELQGQRKRNVLCSELDDALLMWVRENQERNIHVSYKMIIQKAKELGAYIKTLPGREHTEVPAFSNGWVSGFTKRHHLIGSALNAPGASSLVAINELVAGGFAPPILPLSTDEQLITRSLAAKAAREAAEQQMQQHATFMEGHDLDHRMDGENMGNEDVVMEGIEADIHHHMAHAIGPDSQPSSSSASSSTSGPIHTPADGSTAPVVAPVAPPAKSKRGRKKSTGLGLQSREQLRQQAHPAAPGMVSATRPRGSSPPMTPTSSSLLAQSLQQQQQQLQHLQQQAQFNQQTLSSATASTSSLEVAAAAAAAVTAAGVTSTTTTTPTAASTTAKGTGSSSSSSAGTAGGTTSGAPPTARQIPTKAEALAAVQTVINSLNVHIPAEVELLRPLFDMERRLQNELHAGERQSTTSMIWSK
ncbi:hypothetical protein BGZ68_003609 [Mortierella alpina]|nr:hypothetical protein BGZ68_003609 [Mortierella alpina]